MVSPDSFIERCNEIILRARTQPFADVIKAANELEHELQPLCRRRADRLRLAESLSDLRLLLCQLKQVPVRDCVRWADELMDRRYDLYRTVSSIGTFAIYCKERGEHAIAYDYLFRAMNDVDWDAVRSRGKEDVRRTYGRLLDELRDARNDSTP